LSLSGVVLFSGNAFFDEVKRTINNPEKIDSVSPNTGSTNGGTTLSIKGISVEKVKATFYYCVSYPSVFCVVS